MANILFSRAGGLLSLEGRSLLFSSCKASKHSLCKRKGCGNGLESPARILWSEGPSSLSLTLGSEPPALPALLPPWKYPPGLARSVPFLKDVLSSTAGTCQWRAFLLLLSLAVGRQCEAVPLPQGRCPVSWHRPSAHLAQRGHSAARACAAKTRTHLLPSPQ